MSDDIQYAIFARMSPSERWRTAVRLYWSARQLKTEYLRQKHPEWSAEQLQREVKEAFMYARE